MHPTDTTPNGTWTDPRRTDAPVRLLDAKAPQDNKPTTGQWLPGLSITGHNNRVICHGPMGTVIATGRDLCRTIHALQDQQTQSIHQQSLIECIAIGAFVACAPSLTSDQSRRWSALRISPTRAAQCLASAPAWRNIPIGAGHTQHHLFIQAMHRTLEALGFRHKPNTSDAWPILWIHRWNDEAIRTIAHTLRNTDPTIPWAAIHPGWSGWIAIGSGPFDLESQNRACPQCVRQELEAGPWSEILASCAPMPPASSHPGKLVARAEIEDANGCAQHIARTLAGANTTATLRWWPCDESHPRKPEHIQRNGDCQVCGTHHDTTAGPWNGSDTVNTPPILECADRNAGSWSGIYAARTDMGVSTLHDLEWGFASNTTKSARTRSLGSIKGLPGVRHNAGGKGTSLGGARAGAIAEAIERDALAWRFGQLCDRVASINTLSRHHIAHISPENLARFSPNQFRDREAIRTIGWSYVRIPAPMTETHHDTDIRWIAGTDLLAPRHPKVLIPETWTYIGAPPDRPNAKGHPLERYFTLADTNGCAAGPSRAEATARAYCELVERDAFALWWYGRIRRPGINPAGFNDPWLSQSPERFARIQRRLWLLDATIDPRLPVVIATTARTRPINGTGEYDPVFTAGCAPSARLAARRAVTEQVQLGPNRSYNERSYYKEWHRPEHEIIAHWNPESEQWLTPDPQHKMLDHRDYPIERETRGLDFLELTKKVAHARRTSMIAIDLTLQRTILPVVKVASPELAHFWHRLGHPRLYTGAHSAQWTETTFTEDMLNPVPVIL